MSLEEEFIETGVECDPIPSISRRTAPRPPHVQPRVSTSPERRKAFSCLETQPTTSNTNVLVKKTKLEELALNISCSSCFATNMECVIRKNQRDVSVKFMGKDCKFVALDTKKVIVTVAMLA